MRKSPRSGKRSAAPALAKAVRTEREPLEQAQVLIPKRGRPQPHDRRRRLARRAGDLSRLCGCLHSIGESEARSAEEARQWYQQGVMPDDVVSARQSLRSKTGHFGNCPKPGPICARVRGWPTALGARPESESLAHSEALLELNPDDDQGIRHGLLSRYLTAGHEAEQNVSLHRYAQDSSAAFLWSRVLPDLRREDQAAAKDDFAKKKSGDARQSPCGRLVQRETDTPARLPERFRRRPA